MSRNTVYAILTWAILALILGPVGVAVFVLGFGHGDSPCVLCWAQRTAMILVALTGLFVLRFGPRPKYLGFGILLSTWGIYMGIRHSALHAARDIGQGFSAEILGAHTNTWSAFIFFVCAAMMGTLLLVLRDGDASADRRTPGALQRAAMWLFLVAVAGNMVQAFASTGPPPYLGQADPVRFSFNPRHWVWSTAEWSPVPMSLRGRWAVEEPDTASLPTDPSLGPLSGLTELAPTGRRQLALPIDGPITGLAYDAAGDTFLITTALGVYLCDGELGRVQRYTIVDPGFSVDLATFGDGAFLDRGTVMALSENKSFVILRASDRTDPDANFRFFLESFQAFDEVIRSRFATVRAKMLYVRALAYDDSTRSLFTVGVPNSRTRKLVVSRFDRDDLTLSQEFEPTLASAAGLTLRGEDRSLGELYVTGAAIDAGRLLAVSAAYGTLLDIDPATRRVVAGYAVRDLDRPAGLAVKENEVFIVSERGALTVVRRPS